MISDLITKLESATGPDRELDRLIHFHVVSPWLAKTCVDWVYAAFEEPNDFLWWTAERKAEGKEGYHDSWESFTASVGAALSLVEHVFPDAFWMMSRGRLRIEEPLYAIQLLFGSDEILGEAEGNSLPVTICVAALKAKIAQENKNADK